MHPETFNFCIVAGNSKLIRALDGQTKGKRLIKPQKEQKQQQQRAFSRHFTSCLRVLYTSYHIAFVDEILVKII